MIELCASLCAVDQSAVGVHHPFGIARGARCEEHGGHIFFGTQGHLFFVKVRVLLCESFTRSQQLIQRAKPRLIVFAQAPGIVINNALECRVGLTHFQHFVDLLLVFYHAQTHFGVGHGEHALGRCGVLVQGHRNGTQRLRGQHRGIQTGAVGAHHHHVLTALQSCLMKATCDVGHQDGHVLPTDGLPNAIFFLSHGWPLGANSCVL